VEVNGQLRTTTALPPGKVLPGTRYIGGWMGSRASLDAVAKRKNPCLCRESNFGRPSRSIL